MVRLTAHFERPGDGVNGTLKAKLVDYSNIPRLFLIEGLCTLFVAVWSLYVMVPSITQTKGKFFRRKGWFTLKEEKILVNRLLRDDWGKSSMANRQMMKFKMFWEALCDYNVCK